MSGSKSAGVAEQDALSNAFLAIFAILILVLVQIGLEGVAARAIERAYPSEPSAIDRAAGLGWSADSYVSVGWRLMVTSPSRELRVGPPDYGPQAVTGAPGVSSISAWEGNAGGFDVRTWEVDRRQLGLGSEARIPIRNTGSEAEATAWIWLDGGLVGDGSEPYRIAPGAEASVLFCSDGSLRFFGNGTGTCTQ